MFSQLTLYVYDVNCTKHYPYLNGGVSHLEVLHPVLHPVDGVLVALVGDVVLITPVLAPYPEIAASAEAKLSRASAA